MARKTMTPRVSAPTPRVSSPPGSTPKDSSESKPVTLIYSYGNEKMLSYFNLLYTDMGFKNCQKFFHDETITTKGTLSENQFIHFMRRLTDLRDYQIVEMFDIFDYEDNGCIGFKSFFLLFSLITALESGDARQFLYLHMDAMFEIVARSYTATHLTWQEFIRFGYLMGINETDIFNYLSVFNLNIFHKISREDFELYYFVIVDQLDERKTNSNNLSDTSSPSGIPSPTSPEAGVEDDKKCAIM